MAVTYKRQDDLEKMLAEFASFEALEEVEFPDPKQKQADVPAKNEVK